MSGINILLGVVGGLLLLGVIGETDPKKQKNITLAFVAVMAVIIAANTIM